MQIATDPNLVGPLLQAPASPTRTLDLFNPALLQLLTCKAAVVGQVHHAGPAVQAALPHGHHPRASEAHHVVGPGEGGGETGGRKEVIKQGAVKVEDLGDAGFAGGACH